MFDRQRPIWRSGLLHAVLIGGSLVFALPYLWLAGTSFKLDKEIQSDEIRIFPQKPIPTPVSPYIDERGFGPAVKPEQARATDWNTWMRSLVDARVAAAVRAWGYAHPHTLDAHVLEAELTEGVLARLVNLVDYDLWKGGDKQAFAEQVSRFLTPELVGDCFEQAYRCFALGTVRLQTQDYQIYNLTGDEPADRIWRVASGPARLETRQEAGRSVAVVHYDFRKQPRFAIEAMFEVPIDLADPQTGFKRLEVSFRSDQTWHDLRLLVEMDGRQYRSEAPQYLGEDRWMEVRFQLPGPDDHRLVPRRYIRLKEIGAGPQFDHGRGRMKVQVQVERSGQLEAYWAKSTRSYRKAFEEVPFWRYFKTSVFLVVANILGTLLSCSLAAYAFARLNWPGRNLCFVLVLATLMIPPQVTMIPSFVIYKYLGWYNTLMPLWVPNCLAVNGFGIFLLRQAMKGIPRDLEEAAKIDGCSHLRIYWSIILPLVRPTLAAISIFTFMFVWNDFISPLIYVNDQRLYPLALGLFSFMAGRENQFTLMMAGAMIMTLPVIVTFFLAQRYFIQGVTMSGMKT